MGMGEVHMKAINFNDLEALEISIKIEEKGERFYTEAASMLENDNIIEMLEELAEQERDHARTFRELYDEVAKVKENFDDSYLFDPDVSAYLRAMVETAVFPSDEKLGEILKEIHD